MELLWIDEISERDFVEALALAVGKIANNRSGFIDGNVLQVPLGVAVLILVDAAGACAEVRGAQCIDAGVGDTRSVS